MKKKIFLRFCWNGEERRPGVLFIETERGEVLGSFQKKKKKTSFSIGNF